MTDAEKLNDEYKQEVNSQIKTLADRLTKIEERTSDHGHVLYNGLSQRMTHLEERFTKIEDKLDNVLSTMITRSELIKIIGVVGTLIVAGGGIVTLVLRLVGVL